MEFVVPCFYDVMVALGWKDVACSPGFVFYRKLNDLLAKARYDEFVEDLCKPDSAQAGGSGSHWGLTSA